ncbi:PSP family protein, partial [Aphelenchoides avenae]
MKKQSEESLILIDEEGQVLEDDEDDCQVIEEESTHHDLFVIETNHVNEDNNNALLLDENIEIHRVVMPSNGEDANAPKARKSGGGMQCFNCNGAHTLNDCPEPKDQRRISQNRAARYNRNNQGRFHEESNKSFRPGYISDELRDALGIRHNELPGWIYRMRRKGFIEGYPPAYLKRSVTELLNFIHADSEEGEVEDQSA